MRRLRTTMMLTAGVVAGLLVWRGLPGSAPSPAPAAAAVAKADDAASAGDRWMGVATCSAMGCHHANGPRSQPKGSEYSIWAAHDRHTRAYQVLFDDKRSDPMARNLTRNDKATAATTEQCLKCHAMNNGVEKGPSAGERFYLGDGIGCEGCHGPAEKYLGEHYRQPCLGMGPAEKEKHYHLRNTKDLASRAKICTECHVGTADKEVNHDLIAAGHPRLNFEFSGFLAIYPKHWNRVENEATTWAVGQVAVALAAADLLEARAKISTKPWPEFSEYNCYACHKDLGPELPVKKGRRLGSLPWGNWYFTMLEPLTKQFDRSGATSAALRDAMEAPSPNRAEIQRQAEALAGKLRNWLGEGVRLDKNTASTLMKTLARKDGTEIQAMDWERAAQLYLALEALGTGQNLKGPVRAGVRSLGTELKNAFEPGYDSPRKFDRKARTRFGEQLEQVREQLN